MKRITYLLLLTMTLFVFNNCAKKTTYTENLNFVAFEFNPISVVVEKNSTIDHVVSIYTAQITGSDRTFTINVDATSTADAGSYTVPATVTVPANTNSGVFTLGVADVNIAATGVKLVLSFEPTTGVLTIGNMTISIKRFCPLVIQDFLGDFTIDEAGYHPYATTITLDPEVANRIWITNFWDYTDDLAYYDFKADGTVTMPSQVIHMGDGGDYTCFGSGTYNGCAGTFHMTYGGDVAGTVHDFSPGLPGKSASSNKKGM